ncbi:hypothetical protein BTVI_78845 [Pitangus sulphuratus]|nr:hypothetical protein BTVI_78845 [Pitangus sulphuratus]
MVQTVVRQDLSLQPVEVHGGTEIHLQPMKDPMTEPEGDRAPLGSPFWSRGLYPLSFFEEPVDLRVVSSSKSGDIEEANSNGLAFDWGKGKSSDTNVAMDKGIVTTGDLRPTLSASADMDFVMQSDAL